MKKNIRGHFLYVFYLVCITVVTLEVVLRFYYPFQRKIKGDEWKLSTNTVYLLNNTNNRRLDITAVNKRNNIGFRGENPSDNIKDRFTLLTVGGSTTACTFLTEGKTWTDILGSRLQEKFPSAWINNAGLDGHSTYGHINFLYYYIPGLQFKPRIMLFLVGANDVDRRDPAAIDVTRKQTDRVRRWLERNSETVNFLLDIKRSIYPAAISGGNQEWNFTNFKSVYHSQAYIDSALKKQEVIVQAFRKRLDNIASFCRDNDITPVFITQPMVFGDGSPDGGNPAIDFHECLHHENGQMLWKKLQLFNSVTRQVALEKEIHCTDLANLLPRDTMYYYDVVHFTNAGAEKVGEIIYEDLNQYLSQKFPQYLKR